MKISRSITERFGSDDAEPADDVDVEAGMLAKSKEFAASGNRLYLPVVD